MVGGMVRRERAGGKKESARGYTGRAGHLRKLILLSACSFLSLPSHNHQHSTSPSLYV